MTLSQKVSCLVVIGTICFIVAIMAMLVQSTVIGWIAAAIGVAAVGLAIYLVRADIPKERR